MQMRKNMRSAICGRKLSTPPRLGRSPSASRLLTTGEGMVCARETRNSEKNASIPLFIRSPKQCGAKVR